MGICKHASKEIEEIVFRFVMRNCMFIIDTTHVRPTGIVLYIPYNEAEPDILLALFEAILMHYQYFVSCEQ